MIAGETMGEIADRVAGSHQWLGGYFCSCGHELKSPLGFSRHLLDAFLTAARVAR